MKLAGKMLFLQIKTHYIAFGYKKKNMAEHNDLGKWGEEEAVKYLEKKGFVIYERDWKVGKRDLDIIAKSEDSKCLVFVEVKARQSTELTEPELAVDWRKQRNLAIAANAYVKSHPMSLDIRFDIVSVVGRPSMLERIEHIEDAFNPMLIL